MKKLKAFLKRYNISSVNPNINPIDIIYEVVILDKEVSYNEACLILKEKDLRPATYLELLEFEEWDRLTPLIAMGDIRMVNGNKYVHILGKNSECNEKGCRTFYDFKLLNTELGFMKGSELLAVKHL